MRSGCVKGFKQLKNTLQLHKPAHLLVSQHSLLVYRNIFVLEWFMFVPVLERVCPTGCTKVLNNPC